jgi:hypothetical protein
MTTENNTKVPDDKTTNTALLCIVFPEYAVRFCKTTPITEIDCNHAYTPVLFAILDWYTKNYSRAGEWFVDDIRTPSESEITKSLKSSDKLNAKELFAFKSSVSKRTARIIADARKISSI